jgi:hypothetical protein
MPLPRKLDQETVSAINTALLHQQALTQNRIINARRNTKGATTAIIHQIATLEMARWCRDIIITVLRTLDHGILDVKEHDTVLL